MGKTSTMDETIYAKVPHLTVQPCMRYAHPTWLSHAFDCQPERILLPQEYIPAREVFIKVNTGHTGERRSGRKPNAKPGSGVKVLELMSPAWMHMGQRFTIDVVNGRWCSVRVPIPPEILQTVDFATEPINPTKYPCTTSFKVDCQTIQMGLDYLDNDKSNSP